MKLPYIINIQKYSVHDGEGIRTTVFFKGCPLNCRWCHNPESQRYHPELMFDRDKCTGCGYCMKHCDQHAISIKETGVAITDADKCVLCGECLDYCIANSREIVGKQYTVSKLVKIICKDRMFYEESGGGVTLSGGEVMTQDMDYVEALCKRLQEEGISIAIDTCGFAPVQNYERLLPYVDVFLYDLKTLDDVVHQKYMGQSNQLILSNLEFLADHHANINIRIPVIEPINSDIESMEQIIKYLKERIGIVRVNLLPYHNTGSHKYAKLGLEYPVNELRTPSQKHMELCKALFHKHAFQDVKIGG